MTEAKNVVNNGKQTLLLDNRSSNNRSPIGKQFSTTTAVTKLMPLTIYGILSLQNEQEVFVGKVRAKDFLENANWKSDVYDPEKQRSSGASWGYQREISKRRAEDFGRFMTKHIDNFTASSLYLNIRDTDVDNVKKTKVHENAE